MVFKEGTNEENAMTYDEYITKEGVSLPITGFEDLVFDYLDALNEAEGYTVPVEDIMEAIFSSQQLVPHLAELNDEYILENTLPINGENNVLH
jgi:hypothetical protein